MTIVNTFICISNRFAFVFFRLQRLINNETSHRVPLGEGKSSLLLLHHPNIGTISRFQCNGPLQQRLLTHQMDQNRWRRGIHGAGGAEWRDQNRLELQEPRLRAQSS